MLPNVAHETCARPSAPRQTHRHPPVRPTDRGGDLVVVLFPAPCLSDTCVRHSAARPEKPHGPPMEPALQRELAVPPPRTHTVYGPDATRPSPSGGLLRSSADRIQTGPNRRGYLDAERAPPQRILTDGHRAAARTLPMGTLPQLALRPCRRTAAGAARAARCTAYAWGRAPPRRVRGRALRLWGRAPWCGGSDRRLRPSSNAVLLRACALSRLAREGTNATARVVAAR